MGKTSKLVHGNAIDVPQGYSLNLYKKYTYLKSKELEELPRFGVMSW